MVYIILNSVHSPSTTTFSLIPFLGFESFSMVTHCAKQPRHRFPTPQRHVVYWWATSFGPSSSGWINLHVKLSLCPAALISARAFLMKHMKLSWLKQSHNTGRYSERGTAKDKIHPSSSLKRCDWAGMVWDCYQLNSARHTIVTTGLFGISIN